MNITVEIKCSDLAEAINNLAAAMGNRQLQAPPLETEDRHDPRHVGVGKPTKPAGKAKTTPPTSEPETAGDAGEKATPEQETASPSSDDASAIDYGQVKAAVMKVSTAKGRQAAVDLLAEFDAKVGGDLTESQWPTFVVRAAEVLG